MDHASVNLGISNEFLNSNLFYLLILPVHGHNACDSTDINS